MRRFLLGLAALIVFLIVLGLLLQAGPHTSSGVVIDNGTAMIPRGEKLVLETFDKKQYASIVREGSDVVVIGMFDARYPTHLCGRDCPVSVNAVSLYYVTVTELDDGALRVEWAFPVVWR